MRPSSLLDWEEAAACGPCAYSDHALTINCSSRSLTTVPNTTLFPAAATTLLLYNNSISLLQPSAFKDLPSLQTLDLSHNLLANITAGVFEGLGQLGNLNLSHNQLTFDSLSPSEMPFRFLTSLERLNLRNNCLSDVSKRRGLSAHTLQWLDLSYNRIMSSSESFMLNDLVNLTYLDLSHNHLHNLTGLFHGMNSLQELDLRGNQIPLNDSAYPLHVFEPLQSTLIYLSLEGNCKVVSANHSMNYPDQALSKLTNLRTLNIDGLPHVDFGPGFPNMTSLTYLSLSGADRGYCSMKLLTNDTLRSMPPSLHQLNLSGCDIDHIDIDAFRPIRKVEALDLSFNLDLGFDTLGEAFYSLQGSALRFLHINSIVRPYTRCVMVTTQNTRYFKNTSLQDVYAKSNHLETFCEGALSNMPESLRFVSVDENSFGFGSYFKDFGSLKSLTTIFNDGHRIALDPPTEYPHDHLHQCQALSSGELSTQSQCKRSWRPDDFAEAVWTPDLEGHPHQGTSSEKKKLVFTLPPYLETYISRWNKLYYKILDIEFNPKNSLKILNLSNNLLTTWIGPITGLTKLIKLDIANNFAYNVSEQFFNTLTSLRSLNASRNNLRSLVKSDVFGRWLQPLNQLEELSLSKNYLNDIPNNFFKGLVNLQHLDVSHNEIFTFDANITMMKNLSVLDLSFNNIKNLPHYIMDHLDDVARTSQHDVTVNMTFNPIACTCEHIGFLNWMQNSPVVFHEGNSYSCLMSDGSIKNMTNIFEVIKQLQDTCNNKSGILVGAVACFICLMVVLVAAIAYRFRWKLRYLYYASRLLYSRVDNQENDEFVYDAFVSYSSEDNGFVHRQLLEELETRAHLRLNIHNRDFTPGRLIPSNIVDAVQKSRHTLVVLTRELLQSDWCHYEMQMATMEASYTGRDVLIFLLYEDVPSQELPRDVFYNLQASTYIAYPSQADPSILRDFWARLVQAIQR
ncbi:hypothetical protein ACOMHN_000418 [Nucella lapillus]